ncbi:hypothetical protein [Actinomadura rubrisoli]|uniref:Uncharacterized protein n=1 Tax=Actinomadura rubrisoli TaxID=2530368 RepID=A0A4R5AQY1_9ACTN|nr:hypothetical protein [Actinomadura rubrisoli]TDD75103.1 hypothetical protein E1298_31860 [Actinomadura rubrisoli]
MTATSAAEAAGGGARSGSSTSACTTASDAGNSHIGRSFALTPEPVVLGLGDLVHIVGEGLQRDQGDDLQDLHLAHPAARAAVSSAGSGELLGEGHGGGLLRDT